jgi:hypothetical protein
MRAEDSMFVPWPLFGRILIGYLLSCAVVSLAYALVTLVKSLASDAQGFELKDLLYILASPLLTFPFIFFLTLLPFLIVVLITEIGSFRKKFHYVVAATLSGGLAGAFLPTAMLSNVSQPMQFVAILLRATLIFGPFGALGGYVYWRISGRFAGLGWHSSYYKGSLTKKPGTQEDSGQI